MLTLLQNAASTAHARRYHAKQRIANDFVNDARLDGLTLSRSAGSVYYFNGSGVLTATGDNVAAFTSNGLFIEGQATNLITAAQYRDVSTWNILGVTMAATTPTLIDGTTGVSGKNEIKEDGLNTTHRAYATWTAATAGKQSMMVAVKRGSGTRHVQVRINNSTDGDYGKVMVNLDTLAVIGSATAEYWTAYVIGAYTIIELVDTNTTTGTQILVVDMVSGSATAYTGDSTSSLIIDWAQVVTSGVAQSHIQGAATRYQSFIYRPWIGAVNNFWVFVDFYVKGKYDLLPSATLLRLMSVFKNSSNLLNCYFLNNTGQIRMDRTVGGVQTLDATAAISFTKDDRLRVVMAHDVVNGARLRVNHNSTSYTANLAAGTGNISQLSNGANLYIMNYDNTLDRCPNSEARAYQTGTGILTASQINEMIGL